jgi:hypothetical protein
MVNLFLDDTCLKSSDFLAQEYLSVPLSVNQFGNTAGDLQGRLGSNI